MNMLDRWNQLTVADAMRENAVAVELHENMTDAAAKLVRHDCCGAPVVDEQGRCVGVLTAKDFLRFESARQAAENGWRADEHRLQFHEDEPSRIDFIATDAVRSWMSSGVQTISHDAPLLTAAREMAHAQVNHLVVLNETGHPTGVLTSLNVVSALVNEVKAPTGAGRLP